MFHVELGNLISSREGLLGLGYSGSEVDRLLDGAVGERAEELIASALRSSRR